MASSSSLLSAELQQAKLVLLGDMGAGKSSLVLRFVKGQFHDYQVRREEKRREREKRRREKEHRWMLAGTFVFRGLFFSLSCSDKAPSTSRCRECSKRSTLLRGEREQQKSLDRRKPRAKVEGMEEEPERKERFFFNLISPPRVPSLSLFLFL